MEQSGYQMSGKRLFDTHIVRCFCYNIITTKFWVKNGKSLGFFALKVHNSTDKTSVGKNLCLREKKNIWNSNICLPTKCSGYFAGAYHFGAAAQRPDGYCRYHDGQQRGFCCDFCRVPGGFHQCADHSGVLRAGCRRNHHLYPVPWTEKS